MSRESDFNRRQLLIGAATAAFSGAAYGTQTQTSSKPVKFGLVGCGGRGRHDAVGLIREAGGQLIALADLFEDKVTAAKPVIDKELQKHGMPPVAADCLYQGVDCHLRLANSDLDAVLIAITPYFYPEVVAGVAAAGKHIYCEKPVATDVAGALKIMDVGRRIDGKLVFHVGLQVPSATSMQEMARRIHAGAIGKIVTAESFFYWGPVGGTPRPGMNPAEARIRNWGADRILSGDYIVEQNVHALDKINWILKAHPLSACAAGGRKALTGHGNIYDHFAGHVLYPDNVLLNFHSTRFIKGWNTAGERFFGTEGVSESSYAQGVRIFGAQPWDANVKSIIADAEHNKFSQFITDIRTGNMRNETERGAESTLTAILVRTSAYRGREVTWDEVVSSNEKWDAHIDLKKAV